MNTYRSLILAGDTAFERARYTFERQAVYELTGDCYKRPLPGAAGAAAHLAGTAADLLYRTERGLSPAVFAGAGGQAGRGLPAACSYLSVLLHAAQVERQPRTP